MIVRRPLLSVSVLSALAVWAAGCTPAAPSPTARNGDTAVTETHAIKNLLAAYESALNKSDTAAVVKLYADDRVFMPSNAPTAAGPDQLRAAYDHVFNTIRLNIKFEIGPIELFGDAAVVRTMSRGRVTVLATKAEGPEENRELFVLRKVGGAWKICRYMFNKTA